MRSEMRIFISFALALVCACAAPSWQTRIARSQDQNVQVIEMTAKKYEFNPSPVHVKVGTKVQVKVTATDRVHGIRIPATPDGAAKGAAPGLIFTTTQACNRLEKDQQVTIEFVAQTPGSYTFKCCVHCGLGHGGMKGQLIVDQ